MEVIMYYIFKGSLSEMCCHEQHRRCWDEQDARLCSHTVTHSICARVRFTLFTVWQWRRWASRFNALSCCKNVRTMLFTFCIYVIPFIEHFQGNSLHSYTVENCRFGYWYIILKRNGCTVACYKWPQTSGSVLHSAVWVLTDSCSELKHHARQEVPTSLALIGKLVQIFCLPS